MMRDPLIGYMVLLSTVISVVAIFGQLIPQIFPLLNVVGIGILSVVWGVLVVRKDEKNNIKKEI